MLLTNISCDFDLSGLEIAVMICNRSSWLYPLILLQLALLALELATVDAVVVNSSLSKLTSSTLVRGGSAGGKIRGAL